VRRAHPLHLTRQADAIARIHACRNFNGQGFGFFYATMTVTFIARIFNQRTAP
jgi:hypothetical protein